MKKILLIITILTVSLLPGCESSQTKKEYFKQYCNLVEVAKDGCNRIYCDMNTGNLYLYLYNEAISPIYDEYGEILKYQNVHRGED